MRAYAFQVADSGSLRINGGSSIDPGPGPVNNGRMSRLIPPPVLNVSFLWNGCVGLVLALGLCLSVVAGSERPSSKRSSTTRERTYDGLTLEEWRERIQTLRFDDPAAGDAVPGLIELLQDARVPWFTRRQAALTLGRIGQPAIGALPLFIKLLSEPTDGEESPAQWVAKACARWVRWPLRRCRR